MKISLARVDERLIHGQVMTAWCKKCWIKKILLIDDEVAADEFMVDVLAMSAPAGVSVIVKTAEEAAKLLGEDTTDESTLLLFKELKYVHDLVKYGYPLKELDIGNIGSSSVRKPITREVYVSDVEKDMIRDLNANGVYVYIQKLPGDAQVDVLTKI